MNELDAYLVSMLKDLVVFFIIVFILGGLTLATLAGCSGYPDTTEDGE